jgi:c-di-GMP-binding flagellar brake protein YcgR
MGDTRSQHTPTAAERERFEVRARLEIVSLLRDLLAQRALLTVEFGLAGECIATTLLAVNPEFEELVIDYGSDLAADARLLAASALVLSTELDHIPIRFDAARATETTFAGRPAMRIRLPASILRLQRREFFRVRIPAASHLVCQVPLSAGDAVEHAHAPVRVFDLSCGGMALIGYPPTLRLAPGGTFFDCRLELPDVGLVRTDFAVVHAIEPKGPFGANVRRCGGRFVGMRPGGVPLIQRYIDGIQRAANLRGR